MRIMGHRPMRIHEFEEYLRTLGPLLKGEETYFHWRGQTSEIRHLMPDSGFVNLCDPIPMFVSGFGPRSVALAANYGDGAVLSLPPDPERVERVWAALTKGAEHAGRSITRDSFYTCTLNTIVVLNEGEAIDSPRSKELCGAFAIASLHYAYEQWQQFGREPSGPIRDMWPEYMSLMEKVEPGRRHLRIHEGHNCWVVPEEEQFVTAELIAATCLVGTQSQVVARLNDLDQAGLDQMMILPPLEPRYEIIESVGSLIIPDLK